MRLLSRRTPVDELASSQNDSVLFGEDELPLKAQRILGTKGRAANLKAEDTKHSGPDSLWNIRNAEQKSLGTFQDAQGAELDVISGAKRGAALPNNQVPIRSSDDVPVNNSGWQGDLSSHGNSTSLKTPQLQPSVESNLSREYYDATKQPLSVSQQTSASAVRDMALRKGVPAIQTSHSDSYDLAKPPGSTEPPRASDKKSVPEATKRSRKLDLGSLFPQSKSSNSRLLSPTKSAYSPALTSDRSDLSQAATQAQQKLQSSKGQSETERAINAPSKASGRVETPRVKVFEEELYDGSKRHVYRPPKGSQNWFDGFDISSDEEDTEAFELPATELPVKQTTPAQEALPSVFSPYGAPGREERTAYFQGQSDVSRKIPTANELRNHGARPQLQAKSSESSMTASASSAATTSQTRGGGSRLAHSRLGSHSVLSLSSESEDERNDVQADRTPMRESFGTSNFVVENATSLDLQRPPIPVRKVRNAHILDQDNEVDRPINNGQSERKRRSRGERRSKKETKEPAAAPVSKFNTIPLSQSSPGRNREAQPRSSEDDIAMGESAGGQPLSSAPTDASRMMAVTEEEMILLELMRQKRAAMQKLSFHEGYRLGLRQEQDVSEKDRESTDDPALMVLKNSDRVERLITRGHSKTESLVKEELEHRRRLSQIRKEDVDKSFKMGRFLAMDVPPAEKSARMSRFLAMAPGLAEELADRRFSGTDIETESRYGEHSELDSRYNESRRPSAFESHPSESRQSDSQYDDERTESRYDEKESDNRPKESRPLEESSSSHYEDDKETQSPPQPVSAIFSPLQRLTEQVRDVQTQAQKEYQYEEIRALPTPPKEHEQLNKHASMPASSESPSMFEEDSLYDTEANQDAPKSEAVQQDSEQDVEPTALPRSEYRFSDPRVTTSARPPGGLMHPLPQRSKPGFDFAALEHPTTRIRSVSDTTSLASPVSPTAPSTLSEGSAIESKDSEKATAAEESQGIDSQLANAMNPPSFTSRGKRSSKIAPPRIDTYTGKTADRIMSMTSITSAGEDVLAAWAELGGGSPTFAFRKKPSK